VMLHHAALDDAEHAALDELLALVRAHRGFVATTIIEVARNATRHPSTDDPGSSLSSEMEPEAGFEPATCR
jgi:hypothetical protein